MSDLPRIPKHENETKVRLDDEYEAAMVALSKIHRTRKAALMREVLMAWVDQMRDELKRNTHAA
ncbi:hypothetical protein [Pseudomonas sp. ESBL1]|uniref:hypothetical protein n=1 Tax=Pseudomonas sp. ESBL1 TaxID=3077324 RepID=UPI002FC66098